MDIFLEKVNSFVWGNGLIALLLMTGMVYTIRLRFVQFRLFPFIFRSFRRSYSGEGLSQRKTVCMALGTAMGTGNITGVAAAVSIGGAGAVFWLWVSAFFGMAVVYAENSLSALYSDEESRGPMAYISKGLGSPGLAAVFAFMCVLASLGMGGMVQVNSFSNALEGCVSVEPVILVPAVFIVIFSVTNGGAKRIGTAAELLLPLAAALYTTVCFAVIIRNVSSLPEVFHSIFFSAFGIRQTTGGLFGFTVSKAVSTGIRRGIFSNEAGLGSSPILHSASADKSPEQQSMWSMFEVFFDTMICCTITAVTILCAAPDLSVHTALSTILGSGSSIFLAAELALFAFCTIIGWYYCGEMSFVHLTKGRFRGGFCLFFAAVSSLGAAFSAGTVWTISDIFNGLMAFPNLLALILLIKKVKRYKSR